ncbi:hypothetical protein P2P98_14355, partial [Microbacterium sp. Kw_RZR3]|nr:hypothetical protein [Microbacterium sp. Kw_RZR3]
MINTYADLGMPAEILGSDKVVFGVVASKNGFRVIANPNLSTRWREGADGNEVDNTSVRGGGETATPITRSSRTELRIPGPRAPL